MKKMSLGTRKTKWSKLKFTGESQRKNDLFIVKVYCIVSFANSHVEVLWYITSFWRISRKFPLTSSNLIWVEYCTLFPIQFSFVKPFSPFTNLGFWEFWNKNSVLTNVVNYCQIFLIFLSRPYGKDFLSALKKARVKQVRSQAVANELFTYAIFLVVLFVISYANRDADSFQIKNHLGTWDYDRSLD